MLLLATMAFGLFLQSEYDSDYYVWIAATVYIIFKCSALSIAWRPVRRFCLLGFQSDVGYACMALAGASFAVVVLVWIQISTYFLMMIAAAILLRIKLYTRRINPLLSFMILTVISLSGLALSCLPLLSKIGDFSIVP